MNETEKQITEFAEKAVALSRTRGDGILDYTETSLQLVEEILEESSRYVPDMAYGEVTALVNMFGSYILDVGHRLFGGRYAWYDTGNQPVLVVGEPDHRIAIIAFDRVRSRLNGNPDDNIPFFFDGFASRVRKAKPGDDAFYV